MHPEDRDLQRILWRTSPDQPIQEYQLNTVTYGTSSAPFLATRCLNKLADDNQNQQPQAAHAIRNDFYVDDLLSGSNTIEDAMQLRNGITSLLQTAGLMLRKWASNNQQFQDDIPEDSRELQLLLSLDKKDGVSTLGLHWMPQTDQLQVKNSESALSTVKINTKLLVSSEHMRLHHAGSQLLISSLRDNYWIPRVKMLVRTVIHQCLTCYKLKAQASQQLMGELPAPRVRPN
jgi:hypothetical protein